MVTQFSQLDDARLASLLERHVLFLLKPPRPLSQRQISHIEHYISEIAVEYTRRRRSADQRRRRTGT
jgi:hypothetical protein